MKRNMLAPLVAICVILLGLSVGSFFFTPDRAFSENENRYLQTTPELTADNVLSGKFMTEVENYTSDQILLRDFWTGARSALQRLEGRQDISGTYLGADGRYFAKVTDDTFNWDNYQKNLAAVETFFAANDGKRCTALIVPSPAGVLRDSLPEDAPYYDEDRAFAMLEEHPGTAFADARQALAGVADPYYHTDHHWTTAGAQAVYHIWAEATGHTARSYALVQATDRFRGTLYSKVLLPDSVYDEVDYCPDITIESADCDGTVTDSLYDLAALEKKDKYELFLGGNYAKAVLRTGVENGKHLLLIKDSFANSLVPFLCGDYETITMVDLRYCREKIQPLADEADDVLVLYEITNFAADGNLFKLNLK